MTAVTDTAWIIFIFSIVALLALDLGVFNRKAHVIKPREALLQVAVFVAAAVIFNIGVYVWMGPQAGLEFTTGYIMELMLSVDNLFVFVIVFASFCVPRKDQHKVLFYGIIGALVFRLAFIMAGVALVETFSWVLYIFGAFLIFTGIRMVVKKEERPVEPDRNVLVRGFRRIMPVTRDYEGDSFFVRKPDSAGRMVVWATPMFVALLVVETTDIVFAVDSIPAILGITTNPFIVFSSNAFAILGLRSMYFALAHFMAAFCYLKYGLAGILTFIGTKMLVADLYHVPVEISLAVIILILGVAIVTSVIRNWRTGTCPAVVEARAEACPALESLHADDEVAPGAETARPAPDAGKER
ncbi:TerC family protein [Methanoculleus sp. Wushi-C6]|uniref:TerC family protein n=1 Tax=Methanoculleus caldifontis TaxID=2651577 RepID=A0ABU3X3A9_9EURY|nr:TerC family protein [Methanoculleus sp. Wushi-C6]MDV2482549.1 TerC family protein [Methanoculleus sp. Wushi-C6]